MPVPTRRTFIMKTAGLARKVSGWGLLALMSAGAVHAADARYPKRPVRLVVPFTPGGSTDIVARVMADAMQASLGQPVVVENRAGASGLLGAEAVAHSAPDGYTIGLGTISTLVVNPVMLAQSARLNPAKAFVPVVALASIPSVFSVHPSLGVNNYAQFVSVVRAQSGQHNIGSAGMGSIGHLIAERMNADLKIKLHHIPYKGQGPVVSSALSGETQVLSDQYPSSAPYVAAARLIPFAVAAQERLPALPQVPTFTELGYPDLNDLAITWFGIVAPAGTPPAVILKLNKAANDALQRAEVQERLQSMNVKALGGAPSHLTRLIEEANRTVRQMVQEQGLKPIKVR
ncbi:tripartite tricarboxylate transporter substrate binding protein [Comamonas sp. Y33R10-2]|uniref:Bug family tripartite tricarboxylate transporter substrate binding protein n=1 Tax=Comamonas sp. Y33R10-2 TaxID=2853257 RepID=UPI0021057FF9|nr:tripartite tricarboxylate transporter substrate binding protein [Comamonas sp. Y33R10-2]